MKHRVKKLNIDLALDLCNAYEYYYKLIAKANMKADSMLVEHQTIVE